MACALALSAISVSGCENSDTETRGALGIWLEEATNAALGGSYQAGLPATERAIGSGASLGDLDGDGDIDLVLARVSRPNVSTGGPSELFVNGSAGDVYLAPDASFRALTAGRTVYATAMADFDGDGDLDLFLGCAGEDVLLQNRGNGSFRDVTASAGVRGSNDDLTTGGVFADLNNDGLLDLYLINYGGQNRLYINNGDSSFIDATGLSGTENGGRSQTAAIADFDHDGRLDIWVANDVGSVDDGQPADSAFLRDQVFAEVEVDATGLPHYVARGVELGIQKNRSSGGIAAADFDADGFLDVYVTDSGTNELYRWNNASGKYDEIGASLGVEARTAIASAPDLSTNYGAVAVDLDRDGALELFVANGSSAYTADPADTSRTRQLDHLYRQEKAGGVFADVSRAAGLSTTPAIMGAATSRGVFLGDLDGDGDDDVVLGAFNEPFHVWMNDTVEDSQYVRFRLRGTVSAPDPIGAIVAVRCEDNSQKIGWRVAGGGTYGTSDNIVEVSCGSIAPVSADIFWPSGYVQPMGDFADRELEVVEPNWLYVSSRVVGSGDPAPVLTFAPTDVEGGKDVVVTRSDGVAVTVRELPEAVYEATLAHPPSPGRTTLKITVDGRELSIRPMIDYR